MGIWQAATAPLGSRGEAKSREGPQAPLAAPTLLADAQSLLRRFVAYVDPTALRGLSQEDGAEVDEVPIADWNILHTSSTGAPSSMPDLSPSIVVRAHPATNKHLFSVQFVVPGVTARQFWTLMANTTNRYLWDGSIEEGRRDLVEDDVEPQSLHERGKVQDQSQLRRLTLDDANDMEKFLAQQRLQGVALSPKLQLLQETISQACCQRP